MIELLTAVPLFASLKKREIQFLAEIARYVDYPADMVLFREGEIGDRLYLIVEGQLAIIKDHGKPQERLIRLCGAGEHVGEMCFLKPDGVRSATVKTHSAVRLVEITKDDFEALLSRCPSVSYTIARGITKRMLDSETKFIRIIAEKDRQLSNNREGTTSGATGVQCDAEIPGEENVRDKSARRNVDRIQIKTFGNFQVFRGETLIGEREWKAKQPKLLLKAIITRGGTGIPKDVLIEDLWPEASPVSAETNFKVVLHRLRKTLEHSMDKATGSSYLLLKDNLVSLRKNFCQTDLDEFLSLRQKGKRAEDAGDLKRAILHNRSAIDLYIGDFLPEDLYAPWAELKRNELRLMYLDLLFRTADLYQAHGSSKKAVDCYKLIIKADPACEEAYQKLMLIYSNRGFRAEALKMYEDCKKALDSELGVTPCNLTDSIRNKILENP